VFPLAVDVSACAKLASGLIPAHAFKAAAVCAAKPHVAKILTSRAFPQIADSVIAWILINMVNHIRRPYTVRIKPRKAMRGVNLTANLDANVAIRAKRSCLTSSLATALYPHKPRKLACLGTVRKHPPKLRQSLISFLWQAFTNFKNLSHIQLFNIPLLRPSTANREKALRNHSPKNGMSTSERTNKIRANKIADTNFRILIIFMFCDIPRQKAGGVPVLFRKVHPSLPPELAQALF
jgi:hypothetical protein